jgi:hypothetical protein
MTLEQKHQAAAKQSREVAKILGFKLLSESGVRFGLVLSREPKTVKLAEKLYAELMPKTYVLPRKKKA